MLTRLVARDFRNFAQLDVSFPGYGLAIIGENGHGKTNLLEAVSYLSLLRSMRGARDSDVLRFGASAFHIRAEIDAGTIGTVGVGYERQTKKKRASLDGVEQPRLTSALGAVPSVCFSPADVVLVAGGPSERRRFLDVALSLSSQQYLHALQHYRAALARRNAALRLALRDGPRASGMHDAQVSVWEPSLAESGGMISAMRSAFVRRHADTFSQLAAEIGERVPVSLRYVSVAETLLSAPAAEAARAHAEIWSAAFEQHRAQELRRGITLVGPHRDELQLLLGGRELRTFGSAGQQRSAAIALRLLELDTLHDALGTTPLLLLDDPFAELDTGRASRVLSLLERSGVGQVLLTVPRIEDIPDAFTRLERRVMRDGALT